MLSNSGALLANLGVEDEFGPAIPEARVLNGKKPINFALEEPTHLRYIDPTMALDNFGALLLLSEALPKGLTRPSVEIEESILEVVRKNGAINQEMEQLDGFFI